MKTILICGYYGRRNAGDEAILGGMLAGLRLLASDLRSCVATWDPEETRRLHGVDAVDWADVPALIGAVRDSSIVIVGGGGLFQDYWGVDARSLLTGRQAGIAQYAAPILLALMLGKPSMLYAVGVGPLHSPEGRDLARDTFAAADFVSVRDAGSRALLAELGCDVGSVAIVPDPAFQLPAGADPAIEDAMSGLSRPVLGVALRHWTFGVDPEAWQTEVAAALDARLAAQGGTALFVPLQDGEHEVEDDVAVGRAVIARMADQGRAVLAPARLDPLQRFRLLESCDQVLAMRLHGVVAALRGGVPVVALGYDPKVESQMASAGLAEVSLPPEAWNRERIVDALADAGATRRVAKAAVGGRFEIVLDLIRRGPATATRRETALRGLALARVAGGLQMEKEISRHAGETASLARERSTQAEAIERLERQHREQALATQALRADLESERAAALERLSELTRRRLEAVQQRDEAQHQLASLRATLGVRVLARYWEAVRWALPPGSRRRRAAAVLRRRLLGERFPVGPLGSRPGASSHQLDTAAGDELRTFLGRYESSSPRQAALILAPTQLVEEEGQRSTHLALELAGRGVPVVFGYWRWGRVERRAQDRLDQGILQIPLDELLAAPLAVLSAFSNAPRLLLLEFPHPGFFGFVAAARGRGWISVYDVVDDWHEFHRLGQAPWYRAAHEAQLLSTAEAVVAVSPALIEKVRRVSGREGALIPNGMRLEIARVGAPQAVERGDLTLGYFGNMTSAWFDWSLLRHAAAARPGWQIHLIGFGEGQPAGLPPNIHLHGRLPPSRLAAYAANWDAGIIPFKRSRLAEAADTTKLYEYLAMGLPVVVTGVVPPAGTERVVTSASGVEAFVREVERVTRPGAHPVERGKAFAAQSQWNLRVDRLLDLIDSGGQRVGLQAALFEAGP